MKIKFLTSIFVVSISIVACKERQNTEISQTETSPDVINEILDVKPTEKWPPVSQTTAKNVLQENYLLLLDDSGSMKGKKMKQAKEALTNLCKTLPQEHNIALACLNSKLEIPLAINNRSEFIATLSKIKASGGTPLTEGVRRAIKNITAQASKQKGYGAYHLIIVTDGESSDGTPITEVASAVTHTGIQVHVVGFQLNNHALNMQGYVDYKTANNAKELTQAFKEVAAETNNFSDPTEFTN